MKIERVSDNQIRCTLSDLDLSLRNLNLSELAYGSDKARSLFREMIQKASREVGFEAEDIPLMVEAIPLSNESVMLVITKVDDPEEMDTRFSKFAPPPETELADLMSETDPGLEGADELMDRPGADAPADAKDPAGAKSSKKTEDPSAREDELRIFCFESLDKVIDAAARVGAHYFGLSSLYRNPADSRFYLVLKDNGRDNTGFSAVCNMLAEYGTRVRENYLSSAYLKEHYELFIKNRALQSLSSIG